MSRLTDNTIRNLPLPERGQVTYFDEGSPLQLRVSKGGAKTFVVVVGNGQRAVIGRYGAVSLQDARQAARHIKAEKTLGRVLPRAVALAVARKEYLESLDIRKSTKGYYERNLSRLRGSKLQDVTPRELNRVLDDLGHTSRIQAIRTYSAFFNWCIRRHYLDTSPCARMVAGRSTSRARVLSDAELKAVWCACDGTFGTIVKLLILTGQRRGEIGSLPWDWVNEEARTISFPASMKKNGRAHSIPFGPMTYEVLDSFGSHKVIFLARGKETPFNGWSKSKTALDKLSDTSNWTLHDLRRTFATNLQKLGVGLEVIEALLNHVSGTKAGIVGVYQRHDYMPEMREAVERWEKYLAALLS
jgi:integrase